MSIVLIRQQVCQEDGRRMDAQQVEADSHPEAQAVPPALNLNGSWSQQLHHLNLSCIVCLLIMAVRQDGWSKRAVLQPRRRMKRPQDNLAYSGRARPYSPATLCRDARDGPRSGRRCNVPPARRLQRGSQLAAE